MRIHLFDGDRLNFHREYRDSPERLEAVDPEPVSREAIFRRYNLCLGRPMEEFENPETLYGQKFPFLYERMRSNEYALGLDMPHNDLWHGDYPARDGALLHTELGPDSPTFPAEKVRADMMAGNRKYRGIISGWYHTPQNISFHSGLAKEHPEWIMRGKDGKPVPSGWSIHDGIGNYSDEYWNEITTRLCRQMDYFGERLMYLDYTIFGALPDWGAGEVRYSIQHIRFLRKLYREVHRRGGILFTNSVTTDGIHDVSYYEGWGSYERHGCSWRDTADAFMMRRLYERENVRTIPLYWLGGNQWSETDRNYRDYTNLILSQLLFPVECWHDPYEVHFRDPATGRTDWRAVYAHSVPYFDFAFEVGWTRLAQVDLQPAWWRETEPGTLEAYVFAKGDLSHIFTALRHEALTAEKQDVTLSADAAKMNYDPEARIWFWEYFPRDPDKYPRRGGPLPENWDRLFDRVVCREIAPSQNGRLSVNLKSVEPFLTRLAVTTQVPAVFLSLEGKKLTFPLPELLENRVEGTVQKNAKSYLLKTKTVLPAELAVWLPDPASQVMVNGSAVKTSQKIFGGLKFAVVKLEPGKSVVEVR